MNDDIKKLHKAHTIYADINPRHHLTFVAFCAIEFNVKVEFNWSTREYEIITDKLK